MEKKNFMRFTIGAQQFRSYVRAPDHSRQVIYFDHMPTANWHESQCSIMARLQDREETTCEIRWYLPSLAVGQYVLADSGFYNQPASIVQMEVESLGKSRYYGSSAQDQTVIDIVECDTARRYMRGRFTMQLKLRAGKASENWPDRITITDGEFVIDGAMNIGDR
jgi:hypothetical protein